ncbi:hypothetical protein ACIRPP_26555 [Streptomyces sp. NPDC101219]
MLMTPLPIPQSSNDDRVAKLIESEIVIVDEDGTEEPFDATAWFE